MRIFNQNKTQELNEYDLTKGYLKDDVITHHYPKVDAVEEVGHYETVAEYDNGGKDVRWVVDVEGVESKDAYDEEEQIQIYIPYTEAELRTFDINNRIIELKHLLAQSDYRAIKYAEGEYTESYYQPFKEQRRAWRAEINELEAELASLNN